MIGEDWIKCDRCGDRCTNIPEPHDLGWPFLSTEDNWLVLDICPQCARKIGFRNSRRRGWMITRAALLRLLGWPVKQGERNQC